MSDIFIFNIIYKRLKNISAKKKRSVKTKKIKMHFIPKIAKKKQTFLEEGELSKRRRKNKVQRVE